MRTQFPYQTLTLGQSMTEFPWQTLSFKRGQRYGLSKRGQRYGLSAVEVAPTHALTQFPNQTLTLGALGFDDVAWGWVAAGVGLGALVTFAVCRR